MKITFLFIFAFFTALMTSLTPSTQVSATLPPDIADLCGAQFCTVASTETTQFAPEGAGTFFAKLFDTSDYPPRWYCGNWSTDVGWLHVISDLGIFGAYFAIPIVLLYFLLRRPDLPFPRIIWLFATFILACGFGHLVEAGIFWWPVYRFSGLVKAGTATISWITVFMLIQVMPKILKLPSAAILGEKLARSQERLDFALDAGNIGVWDWNLNDDSLNWDKRAHLIVQGEFTEGQLNVHEIIDRIHPDDQSRVRDSLQHAIEDNFPFNETFRIYHLDGSIHHIQSQGRVQLSKEGAAEKFVGVVLDLTEKQLKDEALKASEQNYRTTFEKVALGVAQLDLEGRFLKTNEGLSVITGYAADELINRSCEQITYPDDIEPTHQHMESLLSGRQDSFNMEKRFIRKDGEIIWGSIAVSIVRNVDGTPNHIIAVMSDIQKRKAAEEAVRQSHEQVQKLSLVASKTQHSVVITDAHGKTEWVNSAFTSLTGYTIDDIVGKRPGEVLQGNKTDETTIQEIHDAIKKRESIATEIVNYHKNGRKYWIELKIDPVFDSTGKLTNFIATQVDITSRKNSEQELQLAKARFDRLLESNIVGVMVCSLDGEVHQANDELLRLLGCSKDELKKGCVNWKNLSGERWKSKNQEALEELNQHGTANPWELEFVRNDDSRIPVVMGLTRLDDQENLCIGFVLDTWAQKQTEEKLLASMLAAEDANRAKSEFLALMSHELRTPLNGVIGMTELLVATRLDDRQKRFVNACRLSGQTLLSLVNDVLDLSKIESGKLELDAHPFDLLQLLEDIIEAMHSRASEKNVKMVCHLDYPTSMSLEGDSHRLRQVLINLLGNAIKFTEAGSIKLSVEPVEVTHTSVALQFRLQDTGIGIPEDRHDRLFQEFSQVDSSTSRRYGGTGLGLAICRNIVSAMGGEIHVESQEGVGSTFHFTVSFPRVPVTSLEMSPHAQLIDDLKILVIDPLEESRRFLEEVIQSWNMTAVTFSNAADGLQTLLLDRSEESFDLIVLSSESWNGAAQAVEELQLFASQNDLPVFLIARPDSTLPEDRTGITQTLMRPLGQSQLLDAMVNSLHQSFEKLDQSEKTVYALDVNPQEEARILLVEDNDTNQLFAKELLIRNGLSCDIASNGNEALQAVQNHQYNLIIMDCQMPGMDGFEATQHIRDLEAKGQFQSRISIIALTANAIKGDRERCLEAGMDDYIAKPFREVELMESVSKYLKTDSTKTQRVEISTSDHHSLMHVGEAELFENCLNDFTFVEKLLSSFERDGQTRVSEVIEFAKTGRADEMTRAAHALKGIAGVVSAERLSQMAANIESVGKTGSVESVFELLESLQKEMNDCLSDVHQIREKNHTPIEK